MEILRKHIKQEQIEEFLGRDEPVNWITLVPETCICYGEGKFNNPTNLPVYHTHNKGGIIVCFDNDISFGRIDDRGDFGQVFTDTFKHYLFSHRRHTFDKVEQNANDILYNGVKIASFSVLPKGNKFITTAHLSLDMDLPLVQSICTKPTWKIPGSLLDLGFKREDLLKFVFNFLNLTEGLKSSIDILGEEIKEINLLPSETNGPIDICVMWVNPDIPEWREEREEWKKIELKRGTQQLINSGAFSEARYQEWGFFKYWFRGVEENCPWVNKVFLVLKDKTHIPSWLNVDNPKLRIVYHDEFIPNEALPQYNGPAIETWYSNIPDLSENFIACDDDYYFFNPIPSDLFFENNVPQSEVVETAIFYSNLQDWNWRIMMENDAHLYQKITNNKKNYSKSHLPEARKKSFEAQIIKDHYEDFYNPLMYSHFRSRKGITSWVFLDLMKAMGITHNKPVHRYSKFISLGKVPIDGVSSWSEIPDYQMVCYNDQEGPIDYNCQKALLKVFETKFPNKSSFEK